MTAYGYVRSATGNPAQIEEQRQAILAFLKDRGMEPKAIYADSGSGMAEPEERPGFSDLLNLLGEGNILVIVSYERISRDPPELVDAIRKLKERGVSIRLVTDKF